MIKFLGGIQLTTERDGGEGETPGPRGRFAELTQQQLGKRREGRGIKEEKREASKRVIFFWCLGFGTVYRTRFLSGIWPHSPSWSIAELGLKPSFLFKYIKESITKDGIS